MKNAAAASFFSASQRPPERGAAVFFTRTLYNIAHKGQLIKYLELFCRKTPPPFPVWELFPALPAVSEKRIVFQFNIHPVHYGELRLILIDFTHILVAEETET